MAQYVSACPSCHHTLEVTELSCPHCHVQIRGRFSGHPGLNLSDEQLVFLKLFVQSRGNMRELERILGVSYPTVRGKLDDLVETFADDSPPSPSQSRRPPHRRAILEDVAQGHLTPQEAVRRLDTEQRDKEDGDD